MKKGRSFKKLTASMMTAALACGLLAGLGTTVYAEDEIVNLKWYVGGSGAQADTAAVLDEVNEYLKEKIGCTLEIVETDFGNYDQKMQMVIASQEEYDLCYTANWSNSFYANVNKNAYLELEDLLQEYAPELLETIPEAGWNGATVDGHIYAVPNMQVWAIQNAFIVDKTYADKYGFDKEYIDSLAELEPFLAAIKEDNPNMYPLALHSTGILGYTTYYLGYDELAGRHIPGVVKFDDADLNVINQWEMPELREVCELMYEWTQKGYIRMDAATLTQNDSFADCLNGVSAVMPTGTYKPGLEAMEASRFPSNEIIAVKYSPAYMTTSSVISTMTAVSRTSKHPEKAVQLLSLMSTDEYLFNLITQGIEGKHWEWIEKPYIRPIENSGYAPNADWMYGNQFLAYLKEGQEPTVWEDTVTFNANGIASPAQGFTFDPTTIENEIASVSAVTSEYVPTLSTGGVNPDDIYDDFLAKLEAAGAQTIIDEVQRQVDEWKAANK